MFTKEFLSMFLGNIHTDTMGALMILTFLGANDFLLRGDYLAAALSFGAGFILLMPMKSLLKTDKDIRHMKKVKQSLHDTE